VTDKETSAPLPGVNVIVLHTDYGASTNSLGQYTIDHLPIGTYNIRFEMMGYESIEKLNITVLPDRYSPMDAVLPPTVLSSDEDVIVETTAFQKARGAVVSDRNMDYTEIMRDPGGAYDVQRVMQALPSVVSGTDQLNEIIVRGGELGENLFLLDEIEIPNPNHFGNQGTGGGPICMLHPTFVSEIDFYAGAFPARYGGKASSVMDIHLREGNREQMHLNLDMSMAGLGLFAEGPLADGNISYMAGFHKSYVDLLLPSMGLTSIPKYYSFQGKAVWYLNERSKLIWNGIYGNDKIFIDQEDSNEGDELVDARSQEYATGFTYKTLFDENRYATVTLSNVENSWDIDVDKVISSEIKRPFLFQDDTENTWTLKSRYFQRINSQHDFMIGAEVNSIRFDHNGWADADTVFRHAYYYDGDPSPHYFTVANPWETRPDSFVREAVVHITDELQLDADITTWKYAVHGQYKWKPLLRLRLTAGLRFAVFDYNGNTMLAPRTGLTYSINSRTSFNLGYGQHYQEPAYHLFTANLARNRDLRSYKTTQYVAGLEHLFADDMKGSIEVYYKSYSSLPVKRHWIERDSLNTYDGELLSRGEGDVRGLELFLQKKLSRDFNFTLSYSHYVTRRKDFRREQTTWYPNDYDYRDILTFIGGYRVRMLEQVEWYQHVKTKGWWKAVAWIISPGDELEVSLRWRFTRGRPYTKQTYDPLLRRWYTRWSTVQNGARLPDYHRLDFMILRRWFFKESSLAAYIDIMNIYRRQNIWEYFYHQDGSTEVIYQFSLMPMGGFVFEF